MADCSHCMDDVLQYVYPVNDGWLERYIPISMLLPESHQLFICPVSCGRYVSVTASLWGLKDRMSFLFLEENDLISGVYEDVIAGAVDELLATLNERPRVLFMMVTCVADLLGIDYQPILRQVCERHADIHFEICNLTSFGLDAKLSPLYDMQNKVYGLLKPSRQSPTTVNFIGNLLPVDRDAEVYAFLHDSGIETIQHITDFKTFDGFQEMARAKLNIVISPPGLGAAEQMEEKLGIPYIYLPVTYDLERVMTNYRFLARALDSDVDYDFGGVCQKAKNAVTQTQKALKGVSIAIDYFAVNYPFSLARTLLEYGFQVDEIFSEQPFFDEEEDWELLREAYPCVTIHQPQHPKFARHRMHRPDSLAIGAKAAALTGSEHFVTMLGDETMFGFYGVCKLMTLMERSGQERSDYKNNIQIDRRWHNG